MRFPRLSVLTSLSLKKETLQRENAAELRGDVERNGDYQTRDPWQGTNRR